MSWLKRRRSASLFAPILLAACAVHPVRAPVAGLPGSFEAPLSQASTPLMVPVESLDRWWDLFDDPQLAALIDRALVSAPDARRALAVLAEAEAERGRALADYDPQGALSASVTRQHAKLSGLGAISGGGGTVRTVGGDTTVTDTGFSPSWELDLFGRRGAARVSANADLAAARFDREAARQSLAASVANTLFEARGDAIRLEEARVTGRIARDLAGVGAKRVAAGIGSRADAAALAADAATADADILSLSAALAISQRSLLVLIGRAGDRLDTLPIAARLPAAPGLPHIAPADLLARRPDVRAAEARLRSATGQLRLDQLALFPTINLIGNAATTKIGGPAGYGTSLWSIAAGLTLPILDRKRLLAGIRVQDARTEQTVIAFEVAVQQAYGEAETRLTAFSADQARLERLAEAEGQSHAAFTARNLGFRAGVIDLTTLLAAERTWRANLQAFSELQAITLRDAVDTFKALGGGWTPPAAGLASAEARR